MTKRKTKQQLISETIDNIQKEISGPLSYDETRSDFFARGLSSEGYAAGYRDALCDIIILLNGTVPDRRGWWVGGDD